MDGRSTLTTVAVFVSFILLLLCVNSVLSQTLIQPDSSCEEMLLCRECITSANCIWCTDPNITGLHCMAREAATSVNCSVSYIEDPRGRIINTVSTQGNQVAPTALDLDLRVGESLSFIVSVTPQADYPLDLYILMDLSRSMANELMGIQSLTTDLSTTLGNITQDHRIGFGAFNEKPLKPFTNPDADTFNGFLTVADYSFRHILSLTSNITKFQDAVHNVEVVFNNDDPEALLEALIQVAACTEVIGWRESARKLVLVLTDQGFHIAGEGAIAGIFTPHNGNCYTPVQDSSGAPVDYPLWGALDYPSIGLVEAKLREYDIIPIFSSVPEIAGTYTTLANFIQGSLSQTFVADDTSGQFFLDAIQRSYAVTSRRVELTPNAINGLLFEFLGAQCGSAVTVSNNVCDEVAIGMTVSFNVSVTLTQCSQSTRNRNTSIRIPGLGGVSIQLSEICSCSCEDEVELNHVFCSGGGNLSCGVCECIPGRFGEECRCESEEAVTMPCPVGPVTMEMCSSRGLCQCGQCTCDIPNPELAPSTVRQPEYFGLACECDNFNCPQNLTGAVCSDRGECGCGGICTCEASPLSGDLFTGAACQCPPVSEACLNTANNLTCSDHGSCVCDHCLCEEGFSGRVCSEAIVPIVIDCNAQSCVECEKIIAPAGVDCPSLNCSVQLVDPMGEESYKIEGTTARECTFTDTRGCIHFYFTIGVGAIHAENVEMCNAEALLLVPGWSIAVIIVVGLIILGILIAVLVKVIIGQVDRREVRKWEEERDKEFGKAVDNPMYTSCRQDFDNVLYNPNAQDQLT